MKNLENNIKIAFTSAILGLLVYALFYILKTHL